MTQSLEEVRQLGAHGAELLCTEDVGHVLEMDGPDVGPLQRTTAGRLDVRVWLEGGRVGEASGEPEAVVALAEQALASAAKAPEDPLQGPVPRLGAVPGGLSIRDRRYEQLTLEDRSEVLTTARRAAAQGPEGTKTSGFRYRDRLRLRRFVNTKGVAVEEWGTTYLAEGEVSAEAPDGPVRLWDSIASRSFASIASLPYGTSLAKRLEGLLADGEPLPAGPVRVLLPARAVARLIAAIAEGFVAASFAEGGRFFLQPGAEAAVDGRLHLVDDGTLAGGLRTRSFDDRGVAPVPLTLLREGHVDGRYIGPAAARKLDTRPTGHQTGTQLAPTNLVLKSGTRSVNAMLSDLGGPSLQIDGFPDLSGFDPETGDLQATVHGVVMQANKPVGAMRGVRLRGNVGEVLRQVVEVCSDTDRVGHVDAPALIVGGFEIAG